MKIINEITAEIVKNARDGESIHSLAAKIGFAYSAVHKWANELEKYGVVRLIRKGNRNSIKINKNLIYKKFRELDDAVSVIEKDEIFWKLIKKSRLKARFARGTAITIWTKGSFITGDFYERIYFLEVQKQDVHSLKRLLGKYGIQFEQDGIGSKRPLVCILPMDSFRVKIKDSLPVMPLNELIDWCKKLHLDNILEQLDSLYDLKLNVKYAEASTNV